MVEISSLRKHHQECYRSLPFDSKRAKCDVSFFLLKDFWTGVEANHITVACLPYSLGLKFKLFRSSLVHIVSYLRNNWPKATVYLRDWINTTSETKLFDHIRPKRWFGRNNIEFLVLNWFKTGKWLNNTHLAEPVNSYQRQINLTIRAISIYLWYIDCDFKYLTCVDVSIHMHIAPLLIVCRMWSRCGGWYLLFANGDLLDHGRYVWQSRYKKITDVINFRLPSEVKNLIPVYRRQHLRCGDCRKTRLFEHKKNQRRNKYFF